MCSKQSTLCRNICLPDSNRPRNQLHWLWAGRNLPQISCLPNLLRVACITCDHRAQRRLPLGKEYTGHNPLEKHLDNVTLQIFPLGLLGDVRLLLDPNLPLPSLILLQLDHLDRAEQHQSRCHNRFQEWIRVKSFSNIRLE